MSIRLGRTSLAVILVSVACATTLVAAPAASGSPVPLPRNPLVDPCLMFNDPDFSYTGDQVDALISQDYASLRREIAECQGKALTKVKKPKLKKPKVPQIPGQPPAFWVYVMGSQVETWRWSLPLEPDPVMCTSAISGQRFTVVSPKPSGAMLSDSQGNGINVKVRAGVVDTGWGSGSDCEPVNGADTVDGSVTFDFSTAGIRFQSLVSSDRDLAWEFTNTDSIFLRPFTKKEKAALLNPRKGVLTFTLTHNDAGNAETDTGSCSAWGDDGTCTWAHSWGIKIILVRADPMDLVYGP
jgi:hypothetical protein